MAHDRESSLGVAALAFLSGGLVGAAVALLLAPQSGRQSREQMRGYARRAEGNVHELAEKATDILEQAIDKGREFVEEKKSAITEAVEAGRAAIQRERERLTVDKKS